MQRVELQLGIAKPVPQFGNLAGIVIVEMLAGAKDLNYGDAGVPNAVQPNGSQAMIYKKMSRQGVLHESKRRRLITRCAFSFPAAVQTTLQPPILA